MKTDSISQKYIKSVLHYDPDSGIFTWLHTKKGRRIKNPGGPNKTHRYGRIVIDYIEYMAHRIAWIYIHGDIPENMYIDHIDNNGFNNKLCNLRLANRNENGYNSVIQKNNKTGFKGVSYDKIKRKYKSLIRVSGKQLYLGMFNTPQEAYEAYCNASIKYHKEFSKIY